jgi:MOSC domain-containing protein
VRRRFGYGSAASLGSDCGFHIGDAVITLDSRRGRCPMTTVDPDTLEVDRNVLKDIVARFDGKLALNADVIRPGTIHVGDPVQLAWPTGTRGVVPSGTKAPDP